MWARDGRNTARPERSAESSFPLVLREGDKIPEPIFTPATKAETGHDENISFEEMVKLVGEPIGNELRNRQYRFITAEQKSPRRVESLSRIRNLNGGNQRGRDFLIDEILTPDSRAFGPPTITDLASRNLPSTSNLYVIG